MTYEIRTVQGWKPLYQMAPVEPLRKWWSFPSSAGYDAMFQVGGIDLRKSDHPDFPNLAARRAAQARAA